MHIGLKIKMVRIAKRLSQQELADLIHKTRPLVSHIEQTGNVNERTLDTICQALKISENDLHNFVSEPKSSYKGKRSNEDRLKEEIANLKAEIKTLNLLVESQKEVIELLRKGSKRK